MVTSREIRKIISIATLISTRGGVHIGSGLTEVLDLVGLTWSGRLTGPGSSDYLY